MTYIGQHENNDLIQTWSSMMQKKLLEWETKENTLWIFTDSHGVMRVPKSNLHPRTKISSIGVTNPEIVYMLLLFQMLCIYWYV